MPVPREGDLATDIAALPAAPGVYLFRDAAGEVIYVGKARDLRRRVRSYWTTSGREHRMSAHVGEIARIAFERTADEARSLEREGELIAAHKPRYNIAAREGRAAAYLLLRAEPYPRLELRRRRPSPEAGEAFGPYRTAGAARRALRESERLFALRTCALEIPARTQVLAEPCLLGRIGRCAAPCLGRLEEASYAREVAEVRGFLGGERAELLAGLRVRMDAAAEELRYEEAARLRDRIARIEALERARDRRRAHHQRSDRRAAALASLRGAALLGADAPLERICVFDVATLGGGSTTGAMGVALGGEVARDSERVWVLRSGSAPDDVASHGELARRYLGAVRAGREPRADLLIVDGAASQLGAWARELASAGETTPLLGIAKEPDRLVRLDGELLEIDRRDPGLLLAGALRDRAHARAGRLHRTRRDRASLRGALDTIEGVGPILRAALLRRFGSPAAIRRASDEELLATPGVGPILLARLRGL